MNRILTLIEVCLAFTLGFSCMAEAAVEDRVLSLETQIAELKTALGLRMKEPVPAPQEIIDQHQALAREKVENHAKYDSDSDLKKMEILYQYAIQNWGTQESKESLEQLVMTYDSSSRTGCAMLLLAQMSTGEDRVLYLVESIERFSDCFYEDGVQVGAYALYQLAMYYEELGYRSYADELYVQLVEIYPDAIDHRGNFLIEPIF